jgi:dTDP-4-dehydrorhamnose 3,5-epimerase
MESLAARGVKPSVVNDQIGRLSFTADIATGIRHLLESAADYGTYNLSNDGDLQSWADIARDVYELVGEPRSAVTGVSTEEYFRGKDVAPRPLHSVLDLTKIKESGFAPRPARAALEEYLGQRVMVD